MANQSRRDFLKTLATASAGAGALGLIPGLEAITRAAGPDGQRPNILFIMSDDHAAPALSCYGSRINWTGSPRVGCASPTAFARTASARQVALLS